MLGINAIVKYKDIILSENSHYYFTQFLGDGRQCSTCPFSVLPSVMMYAVYFNILVTVLGFYLPYLKKVMQTPSFS